MSDPSVPTVLGERFERAVAHVAATVRASDGDGAPASIARAFAACALVLGAGGSETEAIAALVHVAPTRALGEDVATLASRAAGVEADAPSDAAWYDRARRHVDLVAALGDDGDAERVRFVGAAIELAGARALTDALARDPGAFGALPGKKFGTLWRLRALLDAYGARDGRHVRLARETAAIVTTLAGKPVTEHELLAAFLVDDTVPEMQKGRLRETVATS